MIQVKNRTAVALFIYYLSIHISILGKGLLQDDRQICISFQGQRFILDYRAYMISCKSDYNTCDPETYKKSKICLYCKFSTFCRNSIKEYEEKKEKISWGVKLQQQLIEIHHGIIMHFQTQMNMRNISQTPFL